LKFDIIFRKQHKAIRKYICISKMERFTFSNMKLVPCPVRGELSTTTGKTVDGRLIRSCGDAVAPRNYKSWSNSQKERHQSSNEEILFEIVKSS
jgi:hypothetical protein